MKKKYMEYTVAIILLLFGLWGWYITSTWKVMVDSGGLSPKTYPRILFTALMFFGAVILIRTLIRQFVKKEADGELEKKINVHILPVAAIVVLLVLYIILLQLIGFIIPTILFLISSMLLFG